MIPMIMLLLSITSAVRAYDAGAPNPNDFTPLQKHVAFFDRNNDGLVYPWETFEGFRAIGAGSFLSTAGALFINAALSGVTTGKSPFPYFAIVVKNIHLAKHGSDSDVYDTEGRFVASKFEEIFSKFARTHADALTSDELSEMLKANREPNDPKGGVAGWTEWMALYNLFKDKDGLLRKETIRGVYDGSLFVEKEKEVAAAKKNA